VKMTTYERQWNDEDKTVLGAIDLLLNPRQ
jgi:hypothetical protein